MRTLNKIRQHFYYALYGGETDVYELDDDGEKIVEYVKPDGTIVYRKTGTRKPYYQEPKPFRCSISSQLNELHARSYGVDQSSIYSEICVEKDYVNLAYGTKIWKDSPIVWKDKSKGIPDEDSSDYTVVGVLDEYINFTWYLLQRNNKCQQTST